MTEVDGGGNNVPVKVERDASFLDFIPPTQPAPPRIDLRTVKREIHEKRLFEEKRNKIRRIGSWFCNVCKKQVTQDYRAHDRNATHRYSYSNLCLQNLINVRNVTELIFYDGVLNCNEESIKRELSKFGQVEYICLDHPARNSMVVVFAGSGAVKSLIQRETFVYLSNCVWSVTYGRPGLTLSQCKGDEQKLRDFHSDLFGIISIEKRFFHQACFLTHALQPSMAECTNIINFHSDFCRTSDLVSSMIFTGLELSGSEIEMTIQYAATKNSKEMKQLLHQVLFYLEEYSNEVKCDYKIPEVKFLHRTTNQVYKIYINDYPKLQRAALLQTLASLHFSVKIMCVLISYWARRQDLDGGDGLNTITIMLLVVYYLQQLPEPVLPSIVSLQATVEPILVQGWNVNFESNVNQIEKTNNNYHTRQLISGFFAFYSHFNFQTFVISVFLGKHLRKTIFRNIQELSDEMSTYKQRYVRNDTAVKRSKNNIINNTSICVLDPFIHCINVAETTSKQKLDLFQMCCDKTRCIFDNDNMSKSSMLRNIFYKVSEIEIKKMTEIKKTAEEDICFLKEEKRPVELITLSDEEDDGSRAPSTVPPGSQSGYEPDSDGEHSVIEHSTPMTGRRPTRLDRRFSLDSEVTMEADDECEEYDSEAETRSGTTNSSQAYHRTTSLDTSETSSINSECDRQQTGRLCYLNPFSLDIQTSARNAITQIEQNISDILQAEDELSVIDSTPCISLGNSSDEECDEDTLLRGDTDSEAGLVVSDGQDGQDSSQLAKRAKYN